MIFFFLNVRTWGFRYYMYILLYSFDISIVVLIIYKKKKKKKSQGQTSGVLQYIWNSTDSQPESWAQQTSSILLWHHLESVPTSTYPLWFLYATESSLLQFEPWDNSKPNLQLQFTVLFHKLIKCFTCHFPMSHNISFWRIHLRNVTLTLSWNMPLSHLAHCLSQSLRN